ncbi:MAG: sulfotransferase [Proteobacteria bacterium]|nr:sulfotransferase [Pseudomonadota bacterium]
MSGDATNESLLREAQAQERAGRLPEAIAAYERLLAQAPGYAAGWFNLGVLRRRARRLPEALAAYQRALDLGIPRPEEAHLNRAVIYADFLRQDAAAEAELRRALELNARFLPALLNLANLQEDRGEREAARATYERLLALAPQHAEALARAANLEPPALAAPRFRARLEAALADAGRPPAERASLGFALGRALDGAGEYRAAFAAVAAANAASRAAAAGVRYDREAHERLVSRLIAAARAPAATAGPDGEPEPVFVCGMFRSGSTLIEQLIASHPGVAAGGELEFLPRLAAGELAPYPESLTATPRARLDELAARYRAAVGALFPGARLVTDKRPDNFLYLGLAKALFPRAKIVHTVRDPLDNCLSLYFLHLDPSMSYAFDLQDIAHYYRQYRRLMAAWQTSFGADLIEVRYDEFVRTPEPVARALYGALGLDFDPAVLQAMHAPRTVKTASVWQVREPLYTRASGRARHYAEELQPLAAALAGLGTAPAVEAS